MYITLSWQYAFIFTFCMFILYISSSYSVLQMLCSKLKLFDKYKKENIFENANFIKTIYRWRVSFALTTQWHRRTIIQGYRTSRWRWTKTRKRWRSFSWWSQTSPWYVKSIIESTIAIMVSFWSSFTRFKPKVWERGRERLIIER